MKLLSTKEAAYIIAEKTGKPLSVRQLQHEIALGNLIAQRIGQRSYAILQDDIDHYVRRQPGPQAK